MKDKAHMLVASNKAAKLFIFEEGKGIKLLQYYDDKPFANETEFTSPPGRSSQRINHASYALDKDKTQKEDLRHHFIHHVLERLYKEWEKSHFSELYLLAEAKTLGDIRKFLHKSLKNTIVYENTLNLVELPDNEIVEHIKKLIL